MTNIQECEYVHYTNEYVQYSMSDAVEHMKSLLELIYNVEEVVEADDDYRDATYYVQQSIIQSSNPDDPSFNVIMCAKRKEPGSSEYDGYLVLPEIKNNVITGVSAYKININVDVNYPAKTIYVISGKYQGKELLGIDYEDFMFPGKSCFLEGRHQDLFEKFTPGKYKVVDYKCNAYN